MSLSPRNVTTGYQVMMRDLPTSERPRERLKDYGAENLSAAELLAILLRVGRAGESALSVATRLLTAYSGLKGLAQASFGELAAEPAVGPAKAAQVKAGLELGRRLVTTSPSERPVITSQHDAYNLIAGDMAFLEQEHVRVILLTTRNQVVDIVEVSRGTVNSAQIRPAEVFREAVRRTCPAIIVAHNHPSGDMTPSSEDIAMTRTLVAAGKVLDIELLDHLIVSDRGFVSLKERGLGF